MESNHEKIYSILMELKEQNGQQTAQLKSIGQEISEVKIQTIKTNGRVTNLEQWRWYILGGMAVLGVTGYAYFNAQVEQSVQKYLTDAGYDTIIIDNN